MIEINIPGYEQLIDSSVDFRSMHDAEVLSIHVENDAGKTVKVEIALELLGFSEDSFNSPEIVQFSIVLSDVEGIELAEFSHQNVIFEAFVMPVDSGQDGSPISVKLFPSVGCRFSATCKAIAIEKVLWSH